MKISTQSVFTYCTLLFLLPFFTSFSQAQQSQNTKEVQVKVSSTNHDQIQNVDQVITVDEDVSISEILKRYGVDTEFGMLGDDEEIEIIIRKKKGSETIENIVVELDQLHKNIEVIEEAQTSKAFLGVYFNPKLYYTADHQGSIVSSVIANTGAEAAGLQEGDLILKIDKQILSYDDDLREIIASHNAGDEIKITYLREDKVETTKATLGKRQIEKQQFNLYEVPRTKRCVPCGNNIFLGVSRGHYQYEPSEMGVLIEKVIPNSSADALGLQAGDVIINFNGIDISTWTDMTKMLQSLKVGEEFELTFIRGYETMTASTVAKGRTQNAHSLLLEKTEEIQEAELVSEVETREVRILISVQDLNKEEIELVKNQSGEAASNQASLQSGAVSIYPNPNNGRFTLSIDMPEKGITHVRLFSLNGVTILEENLGEFEGKYEKDLDISGISKGAYFLQVRQGENSYTKKIITQ